MQGVTARTIRTSVACVVAASAIGGCSDGAPPQVVTPLDGARAGTSREPSPSPPAPSTTRPAVSSTTTDPGATGGAGIDPAHTLATVTEVLDRYGSVLGELSADPAGAPAPGTPARGRWDAVVLPGSPLSGELLDRIHRRTVEDRVVIDADDHGVSFRHVPVGIDAAGPDEIRFRWCGWSPGIGRSLDSGDVVDDAVAHTTGTGSLVRVGEDWRLAALDQHDLQLLPPGSADPCPTAPAGGRS